MSHAQLCDEAVTMVLAASETQATTMSWLFYELARRPEIGRRLRAELAGVLDGRTPSFADIPRLPYLRDVLNEALRLHHPIWNMMRRTVRAVDLPGLSLPANAEILISPVTLHRDARLYPRPHEFDPDRWADRKPDRTAFIPFSAGSHNCVGDHYALTEMSLTLAAVLPDWRLDLAPGARPREVLSGTLRPDRMPMIPHRTG